MNPSKHKVSLKYTKAKFGNTKSLGAFIGQMDEDGCPNGVIRSISVNGALFEGQMGANGLADGFGRWIFKNGITRFGWFYKTAHLGYGA